MCFLCKWDSRAQIRTLWTLRKWPPRETMMPGCHNVLHEPLVKKKKENASTVIKLGPTKQFTKAFQHEKLCFHNLKVIFPKMSNDMIKVGIFVGPQIRQLIGGKEVLRGDN